MEPRKKFSRHLTITEKILLLFLATVRLHGTYKKKFNRDSTSTEKNIF